MGRFNERMVLSLASCPHCLLLDDELNVLPTSSLIRCVGCVYYGRGRVGFVIAHAACGRLLLDRRGTHPSHPEECICSRSTHGRVRHVVLPCGELASALRQRRPVAGAVHCPTCHALLVPPSAPRPPPPRPNMTYQTATAKPQVHRAAAHQPRWHPRGRPREGGAAGAGGAQRQPGGHPGAWTSATHCMIAGLLQLYMSVFWSVWERV